MQIFLNRNEILQLKNYMDNNPKEFNFQNTQSHESGIGYTTLVEATDNPTPFADITDYDAW